MPLDPTALDTTISPGQAGLITDAEAVHVVINELTSTAGADRVGEAGGGTVQDILDGLESIFIPADSFSIFSGSPSYTTLGTSLWPIWSFDASLTEVVVAPPVMVPAHWTTYDAYVWCVNVGAGTGVARIALTNDEAGDGDSINNALAGSVVDHTVEGQYILDRFIVNSAVTADRLVTCRFLRSGNAAQDTLANDYGLVGVELVRTP